MPLFMDYHKGLSLSVEEVKKAHIADEAVQSKYGVIYHQFWVNEQDGTVFCLMEGPSKEACAAVHREAHGDVACSIVEVAMGFYKLFMGNGHVIEQGHVTHSDGTTDSGIRTILVTHIQGVTTIKKSTDYTSLKTPYPAKDLTLSTVAAFKGREVNRPLDDSLVAVFDSSDQAVGCALRLQKEFQSLRSNRANDAWNIIFRMGLCTGQPLTETGDLFAEAITLGQRLCNIANANELLISGKVQQLCNVRELADGARNVRILSSRELEFITNLFSISEEKLSDDCFTIESLSRNIGMSRPQLYRKTVSLTGKSPNDFIRDLRMDKALALIINKAGNISEIALEVGYNNPSYFARCFQLRYGCTPSRLIA